MSGKYYLYITGCDMNRSDAERIASIFNSNGFSLTSDETKANIIIAFACSVREKAVHKVLGKANQWAKMKNPKSQTPMPNQILNPKNLKDPKSPNNPILILTGCILEQDKKKFEEKFDLVFGIKEIEKLNEFLISNFQFPISNQFPMSNDQEYLSIQPQYQSRYSVYVPIMTGCDNFCSYCAVPYTRGREVSRSAGDILDEVRGLVEKGYKEITLLGQNVNSYKYGFVNLLENIDLLEGNHWFRFYANHPKDFSDELIDFLKNSKHFCHYIHLPLQSGDDEILKKMNRHYTAKQYLEIIKKIKKEIPDCAITTDIIVGFPGETEKQFENTVKLLNKVGFDMIFISEYSPRSGTVAARMEDDVSHEEKERRKRYLNDEVLAKSVLANNKKLVGKKVRVLIYKKDRKGFFVGKTAGLKDVRISVGTSRDLSLQEGDFYFVKITKANSWGLEAETIS